MSTEKEEKQKVDPVCLLIWSCIGLIVLVELAVIGWGLYRLCAK